MSRADVSGGKARMRRKVRALLMAGGLIFTPLLTTVGLVQEATPAQAYTSPNYWTCTPYWFYDTTYYNGSQLIDVYDIYQICSSRDGGTYVYYAGQVGIPE